MNPTRSGSCDRGVYGGGGPHPVNPTRSGSCDRGVHGGGGPHPVNPTRSGSYYDTGVYHNQETKRSVHLHSKSNIQVIQETVMEHTKRNCQEFNQLNRN